jgi:hypothetical protein
MKPDHPEPRMATHPRAEIPPTKALLARHGDFLVIVSPLDVLTEVRPAPSHRAIAGAPGTDLFAIKYT